MYIILGILVVSNVYLIFKSDSNRSQRNDEFKKEMRFLKSRLNFNKEQLHLAKIEFKRYSNEKKKLEKKLRRYDLIIIDNISKDTISEDNKDNYYDLAINLNELRIKHWRNIRNIANDTQENKLDSIWSSMKKKIKNQ